MADERTPEETRRQVTVIALARLAIERPDFEPVAREVARTLHGEAMFDEFRGPDVPRPYITCPVCGMTSHHPQDVSNRYCANCHRFHAEMTADEIAKATSDARLRQGRGRGREDRVRSFWYAGLVTVVLALDYHYARGWPQFAWILTLALGGFFVGRRVRRLST